MFDSFSKELYAEESFNEVTSFVYGEPLDVRSKQHNWRIQPHRHKQLMQLFVVEEGGCVAQLDEVNQHICAPAIIWVPNGAVHGFNWDIGSQGYVLSISSLLVHQIGQNTKISQFVQKPLLLKLASCENTALTQLCMQITAEDLSNNALKENMVKSLLEQLLINLFRLAPSSNDSMAIASKPEQKLERFKQLIQEFASEQHQVNWYADAIGVTPAHLNQICRQTLNSTASDLIQQHLIDEAKRLLIYADCQISQVSERVGFAEQSHFTKFFKKLTGVAPSNYRRNFR